MIQSRIKQKGLIKMPTLTAIVRKTHRFEVEWDQLPMVSKDKVIAYGFQQLMNDAAAPAKTEAEVDSLVAKRLDNLRNGVLRATTTRVGDPVAKEAKSIATAKVTAALKKAGHGPKHPDFAKLVAEYAARESTIELAKAHVAEAAELDEIEIDL
jgi:hypothetical protein